MSRITLTCRCGKKIETDSFYQFDCSYCGITYIMIKTGDYDEDYTWVVKEKLGEQ